METVQKTKTSQPNATDQTNKLATMPIVKLVFIMSLPSMLSMLVQAMYNVVDSMFVARVSEDALTAVSLAFPLQLIVIALTVGMGVGMSSFISRKLGEGDPESAAGGAIQGVFIVSVSYLLLVIVGLTASEAFFRSFTDNPEIVAYGTAYIRIILLFSFGRFFAQLGMSILQGSGDMIRPMKAQLIGAVSNIILDPIFIFGLFGIPAMGVAGAALATVLGQIFSMIYIMTVLKRGNIPLKLNFKEIKFNWTITSQILKVGLPAAIMQIVGSVMISGLNLILAGYSTTAVAVMGAYYKMQSFVIMPVFGMTHGTMPILGYSFGAGNKKRLTDALKVAIMGALIVTTLGFIVFQMFPQSLLKAFNATPEMLEIGSFALPVISLSLPLAGISIMLSTVFQACGKGSTSMMISIVRQLVALLPAAYLLGKVVGLEGVWFAFIIGEIIGLIISIVCFYYLYKKTIKYL